MRQLHLSCVLRRLRFRHVHHSSPLRHRRALHPLQRRASYDHCMEYHCLSLEAIRPAHVHFNHTQHIHARHMPLHWSNNHRLDIGGFDHGLVYL